MKLTICIIMEHTKIYYLHKGDTIPFYVGKTRNEYNRLHNHKKTFGMDIHMVIISEVLDWRYWEKHYISLFKTLGYILENKNKGGTGRDIWSKESIEKLKSHPTRAKQISLGNMGKIKSHKGRPFSEKHKNAIKETRGFLKGRPNTWQSKQVLQYDLNENFIQEFKSQQAAQCFVGSPTGGGISACCSGRQKTAYGYIWKFKN
jgi:hypothetical protein